MMINEQGKLFGKINLIDLLLILVVIAGVVIGGLKISGMDTAVSALFRYEDIDCRYTVVIEGIRDLSAFCFEEGQTVTDYNNNFMGKIISVERNMAEQDIKKSNGEIVHAINPYRYDTVLVIESPAAKNQYGIMVGKNKNVYVGSILTLRIPTVDFDGVVENVEVIPANK